MSNLHQSVVDQVRARIGTTLRSAHAAWRIDALIGMGGMAAVFAATGSDGARVAIKILHHALSINDGVRKRFAREGHAANSIGHRGVARVLADGVADDGSAFLVMELLEGETAAARAVRCGGSLPVNEVAFIGEAVADILAAAHAKNVIHRDVKPENVFVTVEGRIVVLDFGIARVADAAGVTESATRTGTMMGTPAFMPPEQARGRANEMDATSDVWALGATLFWLASGRLVHDAETANEQLVAAATLPAPSLSRAMPSAPIPLVTVIDKALEFAKENRFRDAVAMKHALHAAVLAVSWSALPGLSNDVTLADQHKRSPLAHFGAPTMGPVEIPPDDRTSKFVRAAVIGALVGALVLVFAAVAARKLVHSDVEETPANITAQPTPIIATDPTPTSSIASPTISSAASVASIASVAPAASAPSVSIAASASSASSAAPAITTTRRNWLDRRR